LSAPFWLKGDKNMANRRMLSLKVIDTDEFLDMPQSTQLLYFHLSLRADDDGFVSSPKKIIKMIGTNDDDIKVLFAKRFVIPFESGICVIRHWRVHNYIQADRYQETQYKLEKSTLKEIDGVYLPENIVIKPKLEEKDDNVSKMDTQDRLELGKVRLGKDINTVTKVTGETPVYGNEDINFIIKHLKEKCSLNKLDGSDKENRRFAYLAIKKFGSKERVAEIIDIAAGDKFWSGQVSSIKHIYYNGVKIALSLKNKLKNYVEYERIEQK